VQNKFGWTALHAAVDRVHRGAVDLLLEHKANVNAADIFGNTPIHLASRGVDYTILHNLLTVEDSKTGSLNVEGRTPLHFAAACVRPSAVTSLLNAGADVWSADVYKKHPMDVLASSTVCNPEAAVNRGLCSIDKQRPDMCPLPLGNKTELVETKVLLQVAANQQNQTTPCFGPCNGDADFTSPSNAYSEGSNRSVSTSEQGRINFPVLGAIIPVSVLVLLIMLAIYFCQRKKTVRRSESLPRRLSLTFPKWSDRQKTEEQDDDLGRLDSTNGGPLPMNAETKGPFDTVKRLLAQAPSQTETSKLSDTGTDTDSCCGWSSESELEEKKKTIAISQVHSRGLGSRSSNHEDFPTIKVPLTPQVPNSNEMGVGPLQEVSSLRSLNGGLPLYRMGSVPRTKPRDPPIQSKTSFCIRISDDAKNEEESGSFAFPKPAPDRSASTPMF